MSAVVKPVQTKSDLKQFIMLPYRLNRDDPLWMPPLISQEKAQFDSGRIRPTGTVTPCSFWHCAAADLSAVLLP